MTSALCPIRSVGDAGGRTPRGESGLPAIRTHDDRRGRHARGKGKLFRVSSRLYVIVDGPPASGKSTLASALAPRLQLPLVAKDTIKDALMTVLDVPDVAASRHIGRAAVLAMLAIAVESPIGAVIESNFYRTVAVDELRALPGDVVEVFCRCERSVSIARYRRRSGTRGPGHFDDIRTDEEIWNEDVGQPVAGGWPVIEIDTGAPVDVDDVVKSIRAAAATFLR